MQQLNFTQNWNGKLFMDHFGTVRLHNPGKYFAGNTLECSLKNVQLGIITLPAVRTFKYKDIRDVLAFLDTGRPAHYMAAVLSKMYGQSIALQPDTLFDHIVCHYTERNIDNQGRLMQEWWSNILEQSKQKEFSYDSV